MTAARLTHRSLFRDEGDRDTLLAGPWLVDLGGVDHAARIDRVLSVAGGHPALVVWSCPAGEAALHRHLRGLNEVMFPRRPRLGPDADAFVEPAGATHERLLFRHWDPRVLASVAPLLDEEQAARLLGPSQGVALDAGYGRGVALIRRPEGLPDAPAGPLRFTPEQIAQLDAQYAERFRWNTVAYLRRHCAEELADLDDRTLFAGVVRTEAQARALGLHEGPQLRKWAWLCAQPDFAGHEAATRAFLADRANGRDPSARFERMWTRIVERLDAGREMF
ncbi:DUF4123 domain-containing protein [Kitasatospora sp. NPDC097691]|uniref:DUF4123 domain-containing protein n=1 Tax=Kitasatospora sp. NPDC097691 TaxID=3157231 RepID=UPI0033260D7A